jgi:hypothetical protein
MAIVEWIAYDHVWDPFGNLLFSKRITVTYTMNNATPAFGVTTSNTPLAVPAWSTPTSCWLQGGLTPSSSQLDFDGVDDGVECNFPALAEAYWLMNGPQMPMPTPTRCECKKPFMAFDGIPVPLSPEASSSFAEYPLFVDRDRDFYAAMQVFTRTAQSNLIFNQKFSYSSPPYGLDGVQQTQGWSGEEPDAFLRNAGYKSSRTLGWYTFLQTAAALPFPIASATLSPPNQFFHWWTDINSGGAVTASQPWPGSFSMTNGPVQASFGYDPSTGAYFKGTISHLAVDPNCPPVKT